MPISLAFLTAVAVQSHQVSFIVIYVKKKKSRHQFFKEDNKCQFIWPLTISALLVNTTTHQINDFIMTFQKWTFDSQVISVVID